VRVQYYPFASMYFKIFESKWIVLTPALWCGYSYSWLGNIKAQSPGMEREQQKIWKSLQVLLLKNSFSCQWWSEPNPGYLILPIVRLRWKVILLLLLVFRRCWYKAILEISFCFLQYLHHGIIFSSIPCALRVHSGKCHNGGIKKVIIVTVQSEQGAK